MRTYIPELDGVRAIAIILVLLFHYTLIPFGWIGVQIFFVLSGYLISSILIAAKDINHRDYFSHFYRRRVLRILPIYILFTLFLGVIFVFFIKSEAFNTQWLNIYTFTVNLARSFPDYHGDLRISHLWSLSIEEQFYLVWPLLVYLLSTKQLFRVAVGMVILAPLLRLILAFVLAANASTPSQIDAVLANLPFTQMDSFAGGALLALAQASPLNEKIKRQSDLIFKGMVGLFTIIMVLLVVTGLLFAVSEVSAVTTLANLGFIGGYTYRPAEYLLKNSALALLGAIFIYGAVYVNHPLKALLNIGPLRYLGKISYGMYLYHTFILVTFLDIFRIEARSVRGLVSFVPYFCIVVLVSALSFELIEKRFLALKDRVEPPIR